MKFFLLIIFFEIYNFLYINDKEIEEIEEGEFLEFSSSDEDIYEAEYKGEKTAGNFIINNHKKYNYMTMVIDLTNENVKMEYEISNKNYKYLKGLIYISGSILVPFEFYNDSNITFSFTCIINCNFKIKFIFNNMGYMSNNILHSIIYMSEFYNNKLEFIYEPKEENQNYLVTINTTNIDDIGLSIVDNEGKNLEVKRSELFYIYYSLLNKNNTNYTITINNTNNDNLELSIVNTKMKITKLLFKNDFIIYNYINSNENQSCNSIEGIKERWQIRALSDYPLEIFFDTSNKYISSNNFMTVIQEEMDDQSKICFNKIDQDSIIILQFLDVSSNNKSHNFLDPLFINVTNPDYLDPNGVKFYSFEPYDKKHFYNYTFKITNSTGNINAYIYNCNNENCIISAEDIDNFIEKGTIQILNYEQNYFRYSEDENNFSSDKKIFIRCKNEGITCEYTINLEEELCAIRSGETIEINKNDGEKKSAFVGSNSDYFYLKANGDTNYLTIYFENPIFEKPFIIYYNIYEENDNNNENINKYKGIIGSFGSLILPKDFYYNKRLRFNLYATELLQLKFIFFFDDNGYIKSFIYTEFLFIKEFNNMLYITYESIGDYILYVKSLKKNDKFKVYLNETEMSYSPYFNMYFSEINDRDTQLISIESEENDYLIISITQNIGYISSSLSDINFSFSKLNKPEDIFTLLISNENNSTYQIIMQTNNTINYICKNQLNNENEEYLIEKNSRTVIEKFDSFSDINISSDDYSLFQLQFIYENNFESILSPLILNSNNNDILNENEIRYFSIQYLNTVNAENLYVFKIKEKNGKSIKAYVHKCEDYPLCIYNKTYLETLINNKDKNLFIFEEKSKGNLKYEIETSKLSLENVLIVQCENEKCFYNINIEKKNNYTKTFIFIGIIVIAIIAIVILYIRFFKKSSNDKKFIEKINDIGELKEKY